MKKAIKTSKLCRTSTFVRKVFSRTSNDTKTSEQQQSEESSEVMDHSEASTKPINLSLEISALRDQINILKDAVASMQEDTEKKDKALANLAREKEKLASNLKKQRRSNTSLKQQLEDERDFYFKEKQVYCQEMNDCKELKQKLLSQTQLSEGDTVGNKNEITKLKEALNQTLQANYNLSIKFLRMKNTKTYLQDTLRTTNEEHSKAMVALKQQIEELRGALNYIVSNEFESSISPSNKKFIKIVKENGNLMHENLCLQIEIENLSAHVEKYKRHILRTETKNKLPYIGDKVKATEKVEKKVAFVSTDPKSIIKRQPRKTEDLQKTTAEQSEIPIKTLFEKNRSSKIKEITEILPAKPNHEYHFESITQSKVSTNTEEADADLALVQISENPSQFSMEQTEFSSCATSRIAIRTQSAPEIIQTSSVHIA